HRLDVRTWRWSRRHRARGTMPRKHGEPTPMKPFFQALVMACALPCTDWAAQPQERTQFTMDSGRPRAPEQIAVRFEHALLGFRVLPDEQKIEGDATLDFIALSALQRL